MVILPTVIVPMNGNESRIGNLKDCHSNESQTAIQSVQNLLNYCAMSKLGKPLVQENSKTIRFIKNVINIALINND